jgi:hypothetical protein
MRPNQIEADLAADQEPGKTICESHPMAEDLIHFSRLTDQRLNESEVAIGPALYDSGHWLCPVSSHHRDWR